MSNDSKEFDSAFTNLKNALDELSEAKVEYVKKHTNLSTILNIALKDPRRQSLGFEERVALLEESLTEHSDLNSARITDLARSLERRLVEVAKDKQRKREQDGESDS